MDLIYGDSEFHKSLWKSPRSLETPEMNLFTTCGAASFNGELKYFPFAEQTYGLIDYLDFLKSPNRFEGEQIPPFTPKVFEITYAEYEKLKAEHPDVDFLYNIDMVINPEVRIVEGMDVVQSATEDDKTE